MDHPTLREVKGLALAHARALVFCDQETFGFGKRQPIIEWAGIKRKANGETSTLDLKIAVTDYEIEHAEAGALKVNGFTRDAWANATPKTEAFTLIHNFVASTTVVGFSLDGDRRRLENEERMSDVAGLIRRLEYEFECQHIPLCRGWVDGIDLTVLLRAKHPEWGAWNLDEACKRYGIEGEGVHRALGGATRAMAVWDKLMGDLT